jgi:16S rRNA (cytosine967-C5)-methyltransferase
MSRFYSYLNSAKRILESYHGEEPFSAAVKKFFSANKKIGSKDRKYISQLCYSWFRLGKALKDIPVEERILIAYSLCTPAPDELLKELVPFHLPSVDVRAIFPWQEQLSEGIDHEKFAASFLVQPDLFIRIRPGHEKTVVTKLENARIKFKSCSASCIALPNSSKIESVIEVNKEVVIQDYNSQQIASFFSNIEHRTSNIKLSAWDCCAASGGKSLLLYDNIPAIDLTVSDIRESIMVNLKKRFKEAGISKYKSFVADLTSNFTAQPVYDLIIADVPCTGSGTWSRTPEQLFYFTEEKINEYATRQKKILSNIIPALKPGAFLLYITCSVFRKENEDAVAFMQEHGLELVKKKLLAGYDQKADTLFAALLQRS